jgi:hypothetical protein
MVIVDSDVWLIELRYPRDERQAVNARFLNTVRDAVPAITIYTLMEVLGQLSFNLPADRLAQWESWLQRRHNLTIVWPNPAGLDARSFFASEIYQRPFARMQANRMSFMDALALQLAEATPAIRALVTWNARRFRDKTHLPVLTPAEYLEQRL